MKIINLNSIWKTVKKFTSRERLRKVKNILQNNNEEIIEE